MHRQGGSEGSLGCLHRQIADSHRDVKRPDVCTGREGQKGRWVVCTDR